MLFDRQKQRLREFVEERQWSRFHAGKNLAICLMIESSELLEIFQNCRDQHELSSILSSSITCIQEEVGDVCNTLILLSLYLGLPIPFPHCSSREGSTSLTLAIQLIVDAGRFAEHFQWLSLEESEFIRTDPQKGPFLLKDYERVWQTLYHFANRSGIKLEECAHEKLEKTAEKYPASIVKGNNTSYYKLKQRYEKQS